MLIIMEHQQNYEERRKNFMEVFQGNTILTKTIPEVAAQLFHDEFGINIYDHSHIPIVFTVGWTEILKFVGSQKVDEFAIDVCGISLEYVTEYSESDKSTNIVPQLIHKKTPIFMKQMHQVTTGSTFNDELLNKYNAWRTVNLAETIDKIERDAYAIVLNEYGINLMVSATILPLMSATYAAGLQVARETRQTVNMYNIFEIDVVDDDKVLLTPLSTIKQYLKDDSKK
jgi:hypothetical protein